MVFLYIFTILFVRAAAYLAQQEYLVVAVDVTAESIGFVEALILTVGTFTVSTVSAEGNGRATVDPLGT
jgi:hypothetical protein